MTKRKKQNYEPKPLFVERMQKLLTGEDLENYWKISKIDAVNSIRCNTLKISPNELKEKLEKNNNWILSQPWIDHPEIIIIEGKKPTGHEKEILINDNLAKLAPGELGRSLEHMLGYFYVQELSSLLPVIAMSPKEGELYLDICAAPGSKTTQAGAKMNNKGTIIANEMSMDRMRILASNLERCGVTNTIITRKEGQALMKKLEKANFPKFDKILVDAPCSGEGTLRSSPKTFLMWNIKTVKYLSKVQKQLFKESFEQLKVGGELLYSTCTHSPEENEEVVDAMLKEFNDSIEIIPVKLPLKTRDGITEWNGKKYDERVKLSQRLYPQDNNTEGFFVSKFRRIK